jgi:hypothetical protein
MAIDKASLTTKKDRQLNANEIKRQKKMLAKATFLANKYYGTKDLKLLTPRQLDKIITWTTGWNPKPRREKGRTYGRYIKGK